MFQLNENAYALCDQIVADALRLRVEPQVLPCGTRLIDFGVETVGGFEAGLRLAEVCMAGLGKVEIVPGDPSVAPGPAVQVVSDHPVQACMASQYAGWEVRGEQFFAMGSGPMRAAAGCEELFDVIGYRESADRCVGVLESGQLPSDTVCNDLAAKCHVSPNDLTLLIAPTSSQAGSLQIAARSVETALHKLHELGFDLTRVESGWGVAPLPPVASDDLAAIGRTNDAILYGAHAVLYVRGEDESLLQIGPQIPSSASPDHGRPFAEIFARYEHDFYQVDRMLFSPACFTWINLDTGSVFRYGQYQPQVLEESFGTRENA